MNELGEQPGDLGSKMILSVSWCTTWRKSTLSVSLCTWREHYVRTENESLDITSWG